MKQILIIGMGELGKHLAFKLDALGNEVCIVDSNHETIKAMSEKINNAYYGDCMQKSTLVDIGVKQFDICVLAIGNHFQASLEITSYLKELGAKYIISKATTDIQAKFLKMAGADEIIYPEKDIAEKIAIRLDATNLFDYIELPGDFGIFEIEILKSWENKSLKELDIRNKHKINIIAVMRNNKIVMPDANYILQQNDHIYLVGAYADAKKLTK